MQHFGLYAANMQQNAAAVEFLGKLEINYPFLLPRVSNDNFQTILCNFQWINQYAAFLTCMQQVCSSMQQQGLFRGIFCNSCLFWYRCSKSWICIHSVQFLMKKPIYSILACMQQICCRMQQHWFFWVYLKMIVFFYHKLC